MILNFPLKEHQIHLNPALPVSLKKIVESLIKKHPTSKPLTWIMSSGTSTISQSSFKLIGLSEEALTTSAKAVNQYLEVTSLDRWINVLPTFHVGGLGIFYRAHQSQSTCTNIWNPHYKWNPYTYIKSIYELSASLSSLVPTQIFDLVQNQLPSPPSMRAIIVGGARLSEELYSSARSLGWPLLPSFGMTELCSQIATANLKSLENYHIHGVDLFYPALETLSIHELKVNDQNILSIRSPCLLSGYYPIINGVPKEWVKPLDSEGWFQTQDKVKIDILPNNIKSLTILSRTDEVVKVLGENVNLATLRERLHQILITKQAFKKFTQVCTIVAIPHERMGHQLLLIGELLPHELNKIEENFNAKALPFEKVKTYPAKIPILRNNLGKIQHNLIAKALSFNINEPIR